MTDQITKCDKETLVHQFLKVQAQVTVKPIVKQGEPKVHCIDSDINPDYNCYENKKAGQQTERKPEKEIGKSTFTLTQVLCVEIPLTVGVDVDVDHGIARCGKPDFGPCKSRCKKTDVKDKSPKLKPSKKR